MSSKFVSTISKLRRRQHAPVQPSLENPTEPVAFAKARKKKPQSLINPEDEESDEAREKREEKEKMIAMELGVVDLQDAANPTPVLYNPWATSMKTKETFAVSDEAELRRETHPSIQARVMVSREYIMKKRAHEARMRKLNNDEPKDVMKAVQEEFEAKEEEKKGETLAMDMTRTNFDLDQDEMESLGNATMTSDQEAEFRMAKVGMKEKRLVYERDTEEAHDRISSKTILSTQLSILMSVGETNATFTYILPWLIVGKSSIVKNEFELTKLHVTHIMNVSRDVSGPSVAPILIAKANILSPPLISCIIHVYYAYIYYNILGAKYVSGELRVPAPPRDGLEGGGLRAALHTGHRVLQ